MSGDEATGDLLARLAPQVLGALVRRHGRFDLCEDAVQESLLAASRQWPVEGRPDDPRAWLVRVASRRLVDVLRSESARRRREERDAARTPEADGVAPSASGAPSGADDTLTLLVLCCHPVLTASAQVALMLRAVGGLTTAEIARAHLVPEPTMAQRISRAKARIHAAGATFSLPPEPELSERMRVVRHVLYLVFTEGHVVSAGAALQRRDLTREAIRLTREVHRLRPGDGETTGLLALMVLTDARRAARARDGDLVPLADQDRSLWDTDAITEGVDLVTRTLGRGPLGRYQVEAAIAAVHDEAARPEDTDWAQVVALYGVLEAIGPNPVVTLNRAVAVGEADGPEAGLAVLAAVADDDRLAGHHRLDAVRGHLLERAGDVAGAREAYRKAAARATSHPEQRHLQRRLAALGPLPRDL